MFIKAKTRFNFYNPGEVFEADDADAKVWIRRGLAEAVAEKKPQRREGLEAPPVEKTAKGAAKK